MLAITIPEYKTTTFHDRNLLKSMAYAMDMPYGKGNEYTIFGQTKNGPLPAIAMAGLSIKGGIALGASTLLGGLAIAGGISAGLGALTGNKTLSRLGMGLSLASGIGTAFTQISASGTAEFINPFGGESFGDNFSKTIMGGGLEKLKGDLGIGSKPETLGQQVKENYIQGTTLESGGDMVQTGNGNFVNQDAFNQSMTEAPEFLGTDGLLNNATEGIATSGQGVLDNIERKVTGAGDVAGQQNQGGLLSKLGLNAKDGLSIAQGVAGAYNGYQDRELAQPLVDARLEQTKAQTEGQNIQNSALQNRLDNMDMRNLDTTGGFNAQRSRLAQLRDQQTNVQQPIDNGETKYAIVVDGKPQYLTAREIDALRNGQGNGLLMA